MVAEDGVERGGGGGGGGERLAAAVMEGEAREERGRKGERREKDKTKRAKWRKKSGKKCLAFIVRRRD